MNVVQTLRTRLPNVEINQHDIQCIKDVHRIPKRPEFFYKGAVPGSLNQFSEAFVEWIVKEFNNDGRFFEKTRMRQKQLPSIAGKKSQG